MTIGGGEYQSVSQSTWRRSGGSPMSCVEGVRACVQREGETGSKDGRRQRADAASLTFRFLPLLRPSCTSFSFLANMDVARLAGSKKRR